MQNSYTIDEEYVAAEEYMVAGNWGNAAKTIGGIFRLLTNFDSV